MSTNRGATWTKEETEQLLAIWGEENVQAQLESARHNHKIFEQISASLAEKGGFDKRDGKQCQEKIKKLKKKYREVLDSNNKSGQGRKFWEHFDKMNEILGTRPMSRPAILLESVQTSSEDGTVSDDDRRNSQEEIEDERLSGVLEDDEDDLASSLTTPPPAKRKADAGTRSASKQKKTRTERAVELATESFVATMKEADALFLKAEQNIQAREEIRMREFLQFQKEMEERRLAMEERIQQQNREQEMRMMQMFFNMFPQQLQHPFMQPMRQAYSPSIPNSHTAMQPPVLQPGPSDIRSDGSTNHVPPFSEYGPYSTE